MNPYKKVKIELNPNPEIYKNNCFCKTAREFKALMESEFPGIKVGLAYDETFASINLDESQDLYWEIINWAEDLDVIGQGYE